MKFCFSKSQKNPTTLARFLKNNFVKVFLIFSDAGEICSGWILNIISGFLNLVSENSKKSYDLLPISWIKFYRYL